MAGKSGCTVAFRFVSAQLRAGRELKPEMLALMKDILIGEVKFGAAMLGTETESR